MALTATRDKQSRALDEKPSDSGWFEAAETWTVRGVSASDTQYTILDCADLPDIGDADGGGSRCVSRRAYETDSPSVWKVDVRYASVSQGGLTPYYWTVSTPSQRPVRRRWHTVHYERPVSRAKMAYDATNDVPALNSAGDPFDPPMVEDKPRIGLTIVRYETDFDPLIIPYYSNKVASDMFLGFAKYVTRCIEINADPYYENGESGDMVTYNFEFDEDMWVQEILDRGGRAYDENNRLLVVADDEGTQTGGLALLDGTGHLLQRATEIPVVGGGGVGVFAEDPVYHRYFTKDAIPFAPLGFTL